MQNNYNRGRHRLKRMKQEERSLDQGTLNSRWIKIAGVVTLYWIISISMVFINKYLLSSEDLKLKAPFFITLMQCVIAVVCLTGLGLFSQFSPGSSGFPNAELDVTTAMKVMPLSMVFVGMVVFNNLTLKYLGIAFYNVGRSLTTVFNVILTYTILKTSTSWRVLGCCGIIISGFLLGLKEEDASMSESISYLGVVSGVLASLCVALYAIFTKKVLPDVGDNIWRLQFYNNLNAVIILSGLVFLFEKPLLYEFEHWNSLYFWSLALVAGIFGIAIGYVTSLQIHVTSPLTHNVSGTAKACAQTILACVAYSQVKPFWWWVSNVMVLGGSSGYTYVRMLEMKSNNNNNRDKNSKTISIEDGESDG